MIGRSLSRHSLMSRRDNYQRKEMDGVLYPCASITSIRNILTATSLSIGFHIVTLVLGVVFNNSTDHISHLEFFLFLLADVILWSLCLVPLVATYKKILSWQDPYFIFSFFMFGCVSMIYVGYIVDPEYTYRRFHWGSSVFSDFSEVAMLLRFVESEIILSIFVGVMLYVNRHAYCLDYHGNHQSIKMQPATFTGIFCILLGIVGFIAQWGADSFFHSLVFKMGSSELAAESGEGKFVAFQKWAVLTFPITIIGFANIMSKNKVIKIINDFIIISMIMTSVLPMMIYGARTIIIYLIYTAIVVLYRFGIRVRKVYAIYAIVATLSFVLFVTLIRGNRLISDEPMDIVKTIFVEPSDLVLSREPISFIFHLDRVGSIASIVHYLHQTGEYQYGSSLFSGPVNLFIYFANKFSGMNLEDVVSSTDQAFIWQHGLVDLHLGKRPPSLAGEIFMQFGYLGMLPLSYAFSLLFFWIRKKQLSSVSIISYWLFTVVAVELLNSVGAEFGLIIKFIIFHLIPILLIYSIINLLTFRSLPRRISSPLR